MKKALMIIIANMIVISFMGQSSFKEFHKIIDLGKSKSFFQNKSEIEKMFSHNFSGNSSEQSRFSKDGFQKLDSIVYQEYDEVVNEWVDYRKYAYNFNSENQLETEFDFGIEGEKGAWTREFKSDYYYNGDDLNSSGIHYVFDLTSEQWNNNWKYEIEFDGDNNPLLMLYFEWDTISGQWSNSTKVEYNYNSGSQVEMYVLLMWDGDLEQWQNTFKREYSYDENEKLILRNSFFWNMQDLVWEDYAKNEYSYSADGNLEMQISFLWNAMTSEWKLSHKEEFEYNTNGDLVLKTSFIWDELANSWIENSKEEYVIDENNNIVGFNEYYWNENNNEWDFQHQSNLTYNNLFGYSDLVLPFTLEEDAEEDVANLFNHMLLNSVNNSNYGTGWIEEENVWLYYSAVEVGIDENLKADITVYPNPATEYISFRFNDNPQEMQLEIIDMFGKVVLSQRYSNNEKVSVNQLKPALYFYRLIERNTVFSSGKLSVQ